MSRDADAERVANRMTTGRFPLAPALATACLFSILLLATPALAYNEGGTVNPALTTCTQCHPLNVNGFHQGPHADYSTTSDNCVLCHAVHPLNYHVKSGPPTPTPDVMLLTKATIKADCETCHDGTGGAGVYGSIAARGLAVGAQHRIDTTNVIPGGNAATGGSAVATFGGVAGNLSCDDCHNPHNGGTVNPFISGRVRNAVMIQFNLASSSLLKRLPTSATTPTADYGSDWCGGCHKGRLYGGSVHNHPVDSKLVTTTPFIYTRVAILATNGPTASTVTTFMGGLQIELANSFPNNGGNRGFLMPYPRTAQQSGHYPICQQCHANSSFVGTLSADGSKAQAATAVVTVPDGGSATDDPRFQNFPHETQNVHMLVENGDDLCANCHPTSILP